MALGTLNSHAHEDLGDVLGHFQRVGFDLIVVRRGVVKRPAAGTQQLLHHLVHRHIVGDLLLQPVVVTQHRLVGDLLRGPDLQAVRPISSPTFRRTPLRSSSSSTSFSRFFGSVSAMKRRYSSTVGSMPTMSNDARRRNSSSLQSSDGLIRSLRTCRASIHRRSCFGSASAHWNVKLLGRTMKVRRRRCACRSAP